MASAVVSEILAIKDLVGAAANFNPNLSLAFAALDILLKEYRANYTNARFTSVGWKVLSKIFNTSDIQNLHWDINCWGDEEVQAWKNNCISGYGAVAVAVRRRTWTQYFTSV